jgi:hypothetical protein
MIEIGPNLSEAIQFAMPFMVLAVMAWFILR